MQGTPANGNGKSNGCTYYLTELLGDRVVTHGKTIGRLADMVIVETDPLPEVTHLVVRRSFGHPPLLIPMEKMKVMNLNEIVVSVDDPRSVEGAPDEHAILLADHILDKKVIDMEDRDVEVVYDVKIIARDNKLLVSDVNISWYRFLRRLRLKWLAKFLYSFRPGKRDEKIPWKFIQALPQDLGSFRGHVKLKVLKESLAEVHPADIADILEELDSRQRVAVFNQLETERASETLEAIEPSVQRDLVAGLDKQRVAQLLLKMTPGQAADVLSVLPFAEKEEILALLGALSQIHHSKVRAILDRPDEIVDSFATTRILRVPPDMLVEEAEKHFNTVAKNMIVIMYFYVVDAEDRLLGVLDLKELLHAHPEQKIRDVMIDNVITLQPKSTLKEALELFSRYEFRALPVTDAQGKLLGAVPYRDIVQLRHRIVE